SLLSNERTVVIAPVVTLYCLSFTSTCAPLPLSKNRNQRALPSQQAWVTGTNKSPTGSTLNRRVTWPGLFPRTKASPLVNWYVNRLDSSTVPVEATQVCAVAGRDIIVKIHNESQISAMCLTARFILTSLYIFAVFGQARTAAIASLFGMGLGQMVVARNSAE